MNICDYHIHSHFSSDSSAKLEDIANKAIELGMEKICITDHHDIDFIVQDEEGLDFQLDTPAYRQAVHQLQEKYKSKIAIRFGVELGLMKTTSIHANQYMKENQDFDFVIASSHLIDGIDPYYPIFFSTRTDEEGLSAYFETILDNIKLHDDFDVYGHLDYIIRYCPMKEKAFVFAHHQDIFEEIFKILIEKDKGIEINTGSLYKGISYAHPHKDILQLYKDMGGEIITVGSDAHKPEYVGYGFQDEAKKLLSETGFKYFCTFKDRKPEFNLL